MQWPVPGFPTKLIGSDVIRTVSGNAGSKSGWQTLAGPWSQTGSWIVLKVGNNNFDSTDTTYLLDLAVGAAGSETLAVSNLLLGNRGPHGTLMPLHVPAGMPIRARGQSNASRIVSVGVDLYGGEPDAGVSIPSKVVTYGISIATTSGTFVTPSGTSNVKGIWAQLTAATTAPIHALMVKMQGATANQLSLSYVVDIGVGPAGQETVIASLSVTTDSSERVDPQYPEFLPLSLSIPAGVRLAARCAAGSSSATTALEVAAYGFTY